MGEPAGPLGVAVVVRPGVAGGGAGGLITTTASAGAPQAVGPAPLFLASPEYVATQRHVPGAVGEKDAVAWPSALTVPVWLWAAGGVQFGSLGPKTSNLIVPVRLWPPVSVAVSWFDRGQ